MAEQQPEETTAQKPLSEPAKCAENLDDLLAALTIEEYLKNTAKKLPQEEKDRHSGGSSPSERQARSTMFIAPSQWLKRGREGGVEALNAHPPKGMTPKLTTEQKAQIPGLLAKGAEAYGFRGDVWTTRRVAEVIHRTFGVPYHRDHVGRLLREAGWSRQQPIERASQRDEEAIKRWMQERWPAIKKTVGAKHASGSMK